MDHRKKVLSCDQVKSMDFVEFLSTLGFNPSTSRTPNFWYHSPLREEKTPSFQVNRAKNCWYDHGIGKGGNLVDFGILYFRCTVKELLEKLSSPVIAPIPIAERSQVPVAPSLSPLKIIGVRTLQDSTLVGYLKSRQIPLAIASDYCREVQFEIGSRIYLAIGFPNDAGGMELRNAWFKGSSAPKSSRLIQHNRSTIRVFEGFMDFLSFKVFSQPSITAPSDYLILNSTALFEKAIPLIDHYREIQLFLDQDKTGKSLTLKALSRGSQYVDHSGFSSGYKDLNEWMCHLGKGRSRGQKIT